MNKLAFLLLPLLLFVGQKGYTAINTLQAKKYAPLVKAAEKKYGLPDNLLARLIQNESRYKPNATNPSGAQGIAQIIPRWHPGVDPFNPIEAIPYAAKYLARLHKRFGSWDKALAGYNYGPTNVSKLINKYGKYWKLRLPIETKNYIWDILK